MTSQEKNGVIDDFKAEQHVRIKERIEAAKAEQEERLRKAATDPAEKEALKQTYTRNLEYHKRQVALYEQKIAALA